MRVNEWKYHHAELSPGSKIYKSRFVTDQFLFRVMVAPWYVMIVTLQGTLDTLRYLFFKEHTKDAP